MTHEPTPTERFILLRLDEGRTHAEIAAELRVPETTVSSRCQAMRARGLSARSPLAGAGRPAPPGRDLEIVAAWNHAGLSVADLCRRTGLSWESLKNMATRLRKQGHALMERQKDFERVASATHRPEAPPVPEPPRTVGAAADILLRQKRDVRFRGGLVYLDGRIVTLVELFDLAYGPPQGKWR